MKIGIITIHNSPNYGACLQSYALWKYLLDCGYECEIIDLHRPYQEDYVPSKKYVAYRDKKSTRSKIKKKIKKLLSLIIKRKLQKHFFLLPEAQQKFDEFNSQIKLSRPYYGIDDLYNNPPEYDVYVTGSDQLWNPTQPYCLEPYFLTFAPFGKRRISYASSIGITELSENEKKKFKIWLKQYNAISVRETQAQKLLEQITGMTITQVADPTFLLSRETWKSMAIYPQREDKYIFLFTLENNQKMLEYAINLGDESGLNVVYLTAKQPESTGKYEAVDTAGPREWIGYIANAEMVITDSFHGTVFSIITGCNNFFTRIASDNKRGSRITDLLNTFGLNSHLLNPQLTQTFHELSKIMIDHKEVSITIEQERLRSCKFLSQNI